MEFQSGYCERRKIEYIEKVKWILIWLRPTCIMWENGCASFTDFAPVIRDRSALNDSRKSDALPLARDLYFLHFAVKFYDARFYFTL